MSNIPRLLRLKDNHPTAIKLEKWFALADKLGISVSVCSHRVIVDDRDRDKNLPSLYLEDIEDNRVGGDFPPTTEYKLIYDNPAYLAEQERQNQERKRKEEEAKAAASAAAKKAAETRAQRQAQEKEASERKMLAELKAKYEK